MEFQGGLRLGPPSARSSQSARSPHSARADKSEAAAGEGTGRGKGEGGEQRGGKGEESGKGTGSSGDAGNGEGGGSLTVERAMLEDVALYDSVTEEVHPALMHALTAASLEHIVYRGTRAGEG